MAAENRSRVLLATAENPHQHWDLAPTRTSDRIAMVDARDVGACAVAALLDADAADSAWHVTGPAAVTFKDVAAGLGVRYVNVPPRLAAKALRRQGASPFEIDHALRMAAYFASGADGATTDAVRRLTGRAPRNLQQFLTEKGNI